MSSMAATSDDFDKRILLLTGENYTMWALWMKARLMKKGLWHVVHTGPSAYENQEEYDAFDLLCQYYVPVNFVRSH